MSLKYFVKITLISLFIFIIFLPTQAFALADDSNKSQPGVFIKDYDIKISVNEKKQYHIKEKITVNFGQSRHGIYREIPLSYKVHRVNGNKVGDTEVAKVKNLKINHPFTIADKGKDLKIKIGDKNKKLTGLNTYEISYDYITNSYYENDHRELYYNIVGIEWNMPIERVNFEINLPKKFNSDKLGFSMGPRFVQGYDPSKLVFSVSDYKISGYTTVGLKIGEGLTIRLPFNEDYFIKKDFNLQLRTILATIVLITVTIISYILYRKHKKGLPPVVEQVEFYPPDKLSVSKMSIAYKGSFHGVNSVAILLELAHKGYIKIIDDEDYKFIKLKDYDGDDEAEKIFIEGMFKDAKIGDDKLPYVGRKTLSNKFYNVVSSIESSVNSKSNRKIFFKVSENFKFKAIIFLLFIFQALFSTLIFDTINDPNYYNLVIGFTIANLVLYIIISSIFYSVRTIYKLSRKIFNSLFVLVCLPFIFTFSLGLVNYKESIMPAELLNHVNPFLTFSTIVTIFLAILNSFSKLRTPYGQQLYGKILGFKRFLKLARKDELESLVEQNPEYFYDILPFTHIFNLSDKWVKKFEEITIPEVDWYVSTNSLTTHTFVKNLNNNIGEIYSSVSSSPYSSSSGGSGGSGSSGGGFSGGGSGGGGGGSW